MTKGNCRTFRLWRFSSATKQLRSWWSFAAVTWASTTWQFFYLNPLNQVTAIFTACDMHMVSYLCPSIFQERVQPLPNSQSRSWWPRTRVLGQPFSWLQHTCTGTNLNSCVELIQNMVCKSPIKLQRSYQTEQGRSQKYRRQQTLFGCSRAICCFPLLFHQSEMWLTHPAGGNTRSERACNRQLWNSGLR